ncbi:MAG: hypothetical protein SVU32_05355, partial [Candidatus Nanohaloarchaea archaeon]|nr:hypothetical protein [Candidatus Nanohaloarchaea archaeon]
MKGQEQTSSTIFVVGILVIVAATIAISFAGLDRINLPTGKKQAAEGSVEAVSRHLASLADRCWNQAGESSAGRTIACFQVRVEPAGRIEPAAVTAK